MKAGPLALLLLVLALASHIPKGLGDTAQLNVRHPGRTDSIGSIRESVQPQMAKLTVARRRPIHEEGKPQPPWGGQLQTQTHQQQKEKMGFTRSAGPQLHANSCQPPTLEDKEGSFSNTSFSHKYSALFLLHWFLQFLYYCSSLYVHLICLHISLYVSGNVFSFPLFLVSFCPHVFSLPLINLVAFWSDPIGLKKFTFSFYSRHLLILFFELFHYCKIFPF